MRTTSSTLFVRVNTGVTENAGIENARRSKSYIGKPEADTHYWIQHLTKHMTHTSGPSKPINYQFGTSPPMSLCYRPIQFKIIIILITTFHSVRVTNKPQSVSNVALTFLVHTVVIQLLVSGIERHNTLDWTAFVGSLYSLAVKRLPKFFIPTYPVPRFLLPRYISVPSTLNIAFIWASRNLLLLWNCVQHAYSQLTFRRQRPSRDHRWSGWPL